MAIWKYTWEHTQERNHILATNAQNLSFRMVIWKYTWEHTQVRNHIFATNAQKLSHRTAIWRNIWEYTMARNHILVTKEGNKLYYLLIWILSHIQCIKSKKYKVQVWIFVMRFFYLYGWNFFKRLIATYQLLTLLFWYPINQIDNII